MTDAQAVRFNPSEYNTGGIANKSENSNPGCQPADGRFFENPGENI
jgi:hypothetical protein